MSPPLAYAPSICYRGEGFGLMLTLAAFWIPTVMWMRLAGLAIFSRILYINYMSASWFVGYLLNLFLQEYIQEHSPNPSCYTFYALPSLAVQTAFHYVVMLWIHRLKFRELPGLVSLFFDLLCVVYCPAVLWWSGNFSAAQIWYSVLIGCGIAVLVMVSLFVFWMERFSLMIRNPIISDWLGFRHHEITDPQPLPRKDGKGFWSKVHFGVYVASPETGKGGGKPALFPIML